MKVSQGVQAGHDPLEQRALEGKPLFGYDITTCLPCVDQFVEPDGGHNGVCDPRKQPVTDFVRLVERIHAEGNKKRREINRRTTPPRRQMYIVQNWTKRALRNLGGKPCSRRLVALPMAVFLSSGRVKKGRLDYEESSEAGDSRRGPTPTGR